MSIALPNIDLSAAVVGSNGIIDLSRVGVGAGAVSANPATLNKRAQIFLFNESGCTLTITYTQTGNSFKMPAGAWTYAELPMGEYQLKWIVDFLLPNAPISLLLAVYYAPGENIPSQFTLGNSPIGGVTASSGNILSTLSNEGNASPLLVIDMGDVAFNQLVTIYNDGHALWAVDQSGVKHQVFTINNVGTPLQLGQAGDTTEVLGILKSDGGINNSGGVINLIGSGNGTVHLGLSAQGDILDSSGTTIFLKGAAGVSIQVPNGTTIAQFLTTGLTLAAGLTLSAPTVNATTRLNLAQSGYDHLSQFTGGGSGTFGTGLSVAPSAIYTDPCTVSGSSQTIGFTIATSSVVTTGAGIAWFGQASH